MLRLREHLDARLEGDTLVSRAGRLDLADADAEAVKRLLAGEVVPAGALGLGPARSMIEAGLVVAG